MDSRISTTRIRRLLIGILFGAIAPLSFSVASELKSNLETSVTALTDVGWICAGEQHKAVDLNDEHFSKIYHYLKARMFQVGLRNNNVVCELGEPNLQLTVKDGVWVAGFASIAGESLLVYGDDISNKSSDKNILAAFTNSQGWVRQIVWWKTSEQELEGIRFNQSSGKFEGLEGNYDSSTEKDHVFK